MAQRRMFALNVVDTDRFLELPPGAQLLYFHLGMHADDDGFVASPKRIVRYLRCREKDLRTLVDRGLLIPFDSGLVAITDWKLNNSIRSDRYTETIHVREKNMLRLADNKRYVLREPDGCQTGDNLDTQDRIGKDRVEEDRIDQNRSDQINIEKDNETERERMPKDARAPAKAAKNTFGKYGWIQLTDGEYAALVKELGAEELERCIDCVDTAAQATGNKNKWRDWKMVIQMCSWEKWGRESTDTV